MTQYRTKYVYIEPNMNYESIELIDNEGLPMFVNKYAVRYIGEHWSKNNYEDPYDKSKFRYSIIGLDNTTLYSKMRSSEINARINGTYKEETNELPPLTPLFWKDENI